MVTQENALYQGKIWCVYELKNSDGEYNEELRLSMRMSSQKGEFICPECGKPLILCAGPVVEPYFRHHEDCECITRTNGDGKDHIMARRILYEIAKRSFPQANISCSKVMMNYISDIVVEDSEMLMVIEFMSSDMPLEEWIKKHEFYEEQGIEDMWVLGQKRYHHDRPTTFEYLISRTKGFIYILDTGNYEMVIKHICRKGSGTGKSVISKRYDISDIKLLNCGKVNCEFTDYVDSIIEAEEQEIMNQETLKKEASLSVQASKELVLQKIKNNRKL